MSQFPTAIGTKWEFIQFFEDNPHPMSVIQAFSDEVVADTIIGGQTYHQVERSGRMYNGIWFSQSWDTLDGTWYYRVQGSQVKVLDTVIAGQPQESLLYEFGLANGATVPEIPKNLINLTPGGRAGFYLKTYDLDSICANFGTCDTSQIKTTIPISLPFINGTHTFDPTRNMVFEPDFGMMFSSPYQVVLDVYGQYYLLGKLTSGGQTLYEHPMLMTGIEESELLAELKAFPNPSHGILNLHASEQIFSVEVFDILGASLRKIDFENPANEQQLDLSALPRGRYFLSIKGVNASGMKSIVLH